MNLDSSAPVARTDDLVRPPGESEPPRVSQPVSSSWRWVRVVLGLQSIVAGVFSALQWTQTVRFNAIVTGPEAAPALTGLGVVLLVVGGAMLLPDRTQAVGAICLLVFLIPATGRHLLVSRDLVAAAQAAASADLRAALELAHRGQLASFAKNLPLVALAAHALVEWRTRRVTE